MPELPEVETVRKGLEKLVVGKPFKKSLFWPRIIESPEVDVFQGQLVVKRLKGLSEEENF